MTCICTKVEDMNIIELETFREEYIAGLDALMHELSHGAAATEERVRRVIEDPNMHQYAAFEEGGRMVGCATLCVCHTPEMVIGFVEAVVVASAFRGRHLGRQLMERIISDAGVFGVQQLHLTSNPSRVAANGLYQTLGFERKETNVYTMKINE